MFFGDMFLGTRFLGGMAERDDLRSARAAVDCRKCRRYRERRRSQRRARVNVCGSVVKRDGSERGARTPSETQRALLGARGSGGVGHQAERPHGV